MNHDHMRNALILMFLLSLATLTQNYLVGRQLNDSLKAQNRASEMWRSRLDRLTEAQEEMPSVCSYSLATAGVKK